MYESENNNHSQYSVGSQWLLLLFLHFLPFILLFPFLSSVFMDSRSRRQPQSHFQ